MISCGSPKNCTAVLPKNLFYGTPLKQEKSPRHCPRFGEVDGHQGQNYCEHHMSYIPGRRLRARAAERRRSPTHLILRRRRL